MPTMIHWHQHKTWQDITNSFLKAISNGLQSKKTQGSSETRDTAAVPKGDSLSPSTVLTAHTFLHVRWGSDFVMLSTDFPQDPGFHIP